VYIMCTYVSWYLSVVTQLPSRFAVIVSLVQDGTRSSIEHHVSRARSSIVHHEHHVRPSRAPCVPCTIVDRAPRVTRTPRASCPSVPAYARHHRSWSLFNISSCSQVAIILTFFLFPAVFLPWTSGAYSHVGRVHMMQCYVQEVGCGVGVYGGWCTCSTVN